MRPFKFFVKPAVRFYDYVMVRVRKSIRAELVVIFLVCLLTSTFVFGIANSYFRRNNKTARIDYSGGITEISSTASNIVNEINGKKLSINDKDNIMDTLQSRYRGREDLKILI
jgi:aspartyl-tRNA synthetase